MSKRSIQATVASCTHDRPGGEHDDRQGRVEALEQAGDVRQHRVVAARGEEAVPVLGAPVEEVLAAGGVRQRAVEVDRPPGPGRPARPATERCSLRPASPRWEPRRPGA